MRLLKVNKIRKTKSDKHAEALILYASKSGNAKNVAQLAHKYFNKNGLKTACWNIKSFTPEKLGDIKHLLMVVSTDGEGDPPPSAKTFFTKIDSVDMPGLPNLKYSVCALGDSSYPLFCEAGRKIDRRLEELNAKTFFPRAECDADYADTAVKWIKGACLSLNGGTDRNGHEVTAVKAALQNTEFTARLVKRKLLSAPDSDKPCYHIEIKPEERFTYQPGDSIAIKPENPDWLVERILEITEIDPDSVVRGNKSIAGMLKREFELSSVSEQTLKRYQALVKSQSLGELLDDLRRLKAYLSCANVLDMFADFPGSAFEACHLEEILMPVKHRQYTIASAPGLANDVHLVIKPVKYNFRSQHREGACSNYICEGLHINQPFKFRHSPGPDFNLPEDNDAPMVMIANGTGIAPFRAFLQQRHAQGLKGKTWLIFGERYRHSDFYFKDEILEFGKNNTLEKLDLVFSREGERRYVQDILKEKQDELRHWLITGAHIYVCGSLAMGKDVRGVLNELFQHWRLLNVSNVDDLTALNRFHQDIY